LEEINTPEARQLITTLAKGSPSARVTQDAQTTIQRLKKTASKN